MAQYFKWFEQARPQLFLLPSGLFQHQLEQATLLGRGLISRMITRLPPGPSAFR